MRRILHTAIAVLLALSCTREAEPAYLGENLPLGVPTLLTIPFGSSDLMQVEVGTKADAGFINESNIHDLYIFLFDKNDLATGSPRKVYGRYFNFEHKRSSLAELNAHNNECWFVENKSINDPDSPTRGAVKISTVTRENVALVVLANVANSVMEMDKDDEITRLNAIEDLDELRGMTVSLEQDIVNRKNLFLMMGSLGYNDGRTISTSSMHWNRPAPNVLDYEPDFKVQLHTLNAKVKFRIKVNPAYISAVTPVYWQVCRTPNSCHLFSDYDSGKAPESIYYFDTQQSYFEDKETDGDDTYYTFCFYMLDNRLTPTKQATNYYQRELQIKTVSPDDGYEGPESNTYLNHYVENGDWEYANPNSTYVKFDLILTLTPEGIENLGADNPTGMTIGHALTSDAIFTVHLGDFTSSALPDGSAGFNNYNTERGHSYTYTVTVNNTKSIFTEVVNDHENQAGQEGFLLLTDAEIINADAHYDYHSIEFKYRPDMTQEKFAWYVKTPFGEGGPTIVKDPISGEYDYRLDKPLDYLWVKFSVNEKDGSGAYYKKRLAYPGEGKYDPSWDPKSGDPVPELMDITQLIKYIFHETEKHKNGESSDFSADNPGDTPVIRVTAFIDEYYYEKDPTDENAQTDPDLWRKFVNAQPRELHILSDARSSRDRRSDVIQSSHSVILQSIQTIYNVGAANLTTLWGCEHTDEMREKTNGWPYWPGGESKYVAGRAGAGNTEIGRENGRLNSAYIWELYSSKGAGGTDQTDKTWSTYLDYNVENERPELNETHHGMAYSCLTRNRDNNGNGIIDRNEVRWYLAAHRQLLGMWVGEYALSLSARLYQPYPGEWRHHVVSSTDHLTSWAEEGGNATQYSWDFESGRHTWSSITDAAVGETVRCIRNIGTYSEGGVLKDISEAPYEQEIERYFQLDQNEDGSYTFYFDRLNPISLRELCETELPYHDQNNISNCLYLKMQVQSPSQNVGDDAEDAFSLDLKDINEDVTEKGYNPYCPPGYRFPNQSELLLMYSYLPVDYFLNDKNGEAYNPHVYMPSRTYFDRGMIGRVTTGMSAEDINREQQKVGWAYYTSSRKLHCVDWNKSPIKRTRCVRDVDMTGYIDGSISMPETEVLPGDAHTVKFHFFSSASAFVFASLKLCYTDHNGDYLERDIPVMNVPSGMQYNAEQSIEIPTLATLGLTPADLDTDKKYMKLKIELRNASGMVSAFEEPFRLAASHLTRCSISLPSESIPDQGMPVRIAIGNRNNKATLTNVSLHWKASDGDWQTIVLEDGSHNLTTFAQDIYLRSIIGDGAWSTEANRYKEYQFYVTASCSDGTDYISETLANQILLLNVRPNADGAWSIYPDSGEYHQWNDPWWQEGIIPWTTPNNANNWYNSLPSTGTNQGFRQKNVISHTLPGMQIANLNFPNGDFIEAGMDVSQCVFVRTIDGKLSDSGPKDQTVGMDNIFGFATSEANLNWGKGSFQCYYPAHTDATNTAPATDKLQVDALDINSTKFGKKQVGTIDSSILNLKLCSDGFSWNGNLLASDTKWDNQNADYNATVPNLLTKSTLWVGAVEGKHLTRALYNFIRVVRVKEPAVTPVPRD